MYGCVVSVNGSRMMKIRSNLSVSHFIVSIEVKVLILFNEETGDDCKCY